MDVNLEMDGRAGRAEVDGLRRTKAFRIFLDRNDIRWGVVNVLRICGEMSDLRAASLGGGETNQSGGGFLRVWCRTTTRHRGPSEEMPA